MSDERRDRLYDELAVVGKAFGSARRLQLVELLAQREHGVEELARTAGMGVSTVSAHLQVLKAANLVSTRREGTRIHYRLAGPDVLALYAGMREVATRRSPDVAHALAAHLEIPGERGVDTVSADELRRMTGEGDLTLLDVRPREEFVAGHIPGARSVPLETLVDLVPDLDASVPVVTYCRGRFCVLAHDAVRVLGAHGVAARRLEDGMLEWRGRGLPVQEGSDPAMAP